MMQLRQPREGLPRIPARMSLLPIDARGYPVPWFVEWINGEPDFRVMDRRKWHLAIRFGDCWLCGEPVGKLKTFVIGPMCAVNRTTSEPAETPAAQSRRVQTVSISEDIGSGVRALDHWDRMAHGGWDENG